MASAAFPAPGSVGKLPHADRLLRYDRLDPGHLRLHPFQPGYRLANRSQVAILAVQKRLEGFPGRLQPGEHLGEAFGDVRELILVVGHGVIWK